MQRAPRLFMLMRAYRVSVVVHAVARLQRLRNKTLPHITTKPRCISDRYSTDGAQSCEGAAVVVPKALAALIFGPRYTDWVVIIDGYGADCATNELQQLGAKTRTMWAPAAIVRVKFAARPAPSR
jgi:hypothetical protein